MAAVVAITLSPRAALADADEAGHRIEARATEYKQFLWQGATARRAIRVARGWAEAAGFRALDPSDRASCSGLRPGDGVIFAGGDRAALLVRVGRAPVTRRGLRLVGAHVDSPALRLAAEAGRNRSGHFALTAVPYGGVRWYQWRRPLRLVGHAIASDGRSVDVDLGGEFALVADELVGKPRSKRKTVALIAASGEAARGAFARELRTVGLRPRDLLTAEIYAVPAEQPRDVGLDGELVGAAGQDDRALSYAALRGLLDARVSRVGAAVWLVDREEIGSTGRGGARAGLLEAALACLALQGRRRSRHLDLDVQRALARSVMISADVKAALNPNWPEVQEPGNAPRIGAGPTLVKYTGKLGKQGASDAHPERVRAVVDVARSRGIPLQHSESGRVDEGGGGTIAKFVAARGVDVVDVGLPLLSMHSPLELVAKRDLSAAADLFQAFFESDSP